MARLALPALAGLVDGSRHETFRLFSSTPIMSVVRDASGAFRRQAGDRPWRSDDSDSSRPGPSRLMRDAGQSVHAYTGRKKTYGQSGGRTGSNHSSPSRPQKKAFGLRFAEQDAPVTISAQTGRRDSQASNNDIRAAASPTRGPDEIHQPLATTRQRIRPPASDPIALPAIPAASRHPSSSETSNETRSWRPTKKLTYQAMAGLRALHANDPKTFDRNALSERFGISYEAVNRILRSKYQDRKGGQTGKTLEGTKWDLDARSSRTSPVPAVKRAFAARQK